jgi:hypothetical protein
VEGVVVVVGAAASKGGGREGKGHVFGFSFPSQESHSQISLMVITTFSPHLVAVAVALALSIIHIRRYLVRSAAPRKRPLSARESDLATLFRLNAQDPHCHLYSLPPPLLRSVVGYDPVSLENKALNAFAVVKQGTECIFARKAVVWGCDEGGDVDEVLDRSLRCFSLFAASRGGVDGFLFAVRPGRIGTVEEHARAVRDVLFGLAERDPTGQNCCKSPFAFKKGWVFSFAGAEMFVTSFAPCYPASSSRYSFGDPFGFSFVLLQPYTSFVHHDVGDDTPITLDPPQSVRDRIRVAYKRAGREYTVPQSVASPVALEFVPPSVEWWRV